jgi:ABC-2 type transport system permease protein
MYNALRAEIIRYYRIQWSNPGDSLSWFLYAFLVFAAAIIILNGVSGGAYGREEQLLVLVGWLAWVVASDCMAELPYIISEEAQTGTLEQVCLLPVPLAGILALRSLAFLLGSGAKGLVAVLLTALFVAPLPNSPVLLLIFAISLLGAYGLGFAFAGLALVFKRTQALVGLVFSLMIFLTGSLVGLESLGWVYQVLKFAFPLTWGISLMRAALGSQVLNLTIDLTGMMLHSGGYCLLGIIIMHLGYRKSRRAGSLAHY